MDHPTVPRSEDGAYSRSASATYARSMRRLRLLTAGESHGPGLTAILEGLPAGSAGGPGGDRRLAGPAPTRLRPRRPAADREGPGRGDRWAARRPHLRLAVGARGRQPRLEELVGGDGSVAGGRRAGRQASGHQAAAGPRRLLRRARHRPARRHAQRARTRLGARDRGPGGRGRGVRPAARPLRGRDALGGASGRSPRGATTAPPDWELSGGGPTRLAAGHPAARRRGAIWWRRCARPAETARPWAAWSARWCGGCRPGSAPTPTGIASSTDGSPRPWCRSPRSRRRPSAPASRWPAVHGLRGPRPDRPGERGLERIVQSRRRPRGRRHQRRRPGGAGLLQADLDPAPGPAFGGPRHRRGRRPPFGSDPTSPPSAPRR